MTSIFNYFSGIFSPCGGRVDSGGWLRWNNPQPDLNCRISTTEDTEHISQVRLKVLGHEFSIIGNSLLIKFKMFAQRGKGAGAGPSVGGLKVA